jgi:hypothetical protein
MRDPLLVSLASPRIGRSARKSSLAAISARQTRQRAPDAFLTRIALRDPRGTHGRSSLAAFAARGASRSEPEAPWRCPRALSKWATLNMGGRPVRRPLLVGLVSQARFCFRHFFDLSIAFLAPMVRSLASPSIVIRWPSLRRGIFRRRVANSGSNPSPRCSAKRCNAANM